MAKYIVKVNNKKYTVEISDNIDVNEVKEIIEAVQNDKVPKNLDKMI